MNLRPFQIFVLALFIILAIVALLLLSGYSSSRSSEELRYGSSVTIWGPLDEKPFFDVIQEIRRSDKGFNVVEYTQIDPRNFNTLLVNAIAEGRSPDLVLLPSSELVRQRSKLLPISYDTIPERTFLDTYIVGAEIFARRDGIYALPLMVDPLVLYWNRDIFATGGLAEAPTTWEYVVSTVVPSVLSRDNQRNIFRAAIAFGEFRNVNVAKEILLMLAMQSGSRMVYEDETKYLVELNRSVNNAGLPPLEAAAQFFINFSNVNSRVYSWNRSQPLDRNAFVAEDLAMYVGFGSEVDLIEEQNPNLNFDMARIPQGASATIRRTYGEFYGLAIPNASQNKEGAFLAANVLTGSQYATQLADSYIMAPTGRSNVGARQSDPYRDIIYSEALTARGWLDPAPDATDSILQAMIEDITSGRESLSGSISDATTKILQLF